MTEAILSPQVIAAALGQFPPTDEQVEVISSPLQPALVVAGAGSGKTETMAARVVWLVANRIVRRDQVLGLTFTRKAAGELAERIQRRLARLAEFEQHGLLAHLPALHAAGELDVFARLERGGEPDRARRAQMALLAERVGAAAASDDGESLLHRPTVATYNSFADSIVRENAVRIGRDPEAAVMSESAAWLRMRRVVLDSDDDRLEGIDRAVRTIIDAALRIARDGVDNLVDLDLLEAFPAQFRHILELPSENRRTVVHGDVRKVCTNVDALEVLVGLAREYAVQKRRIGVIDFSDQVAGALQVIESHPVVAAELRDRYRVVLLDEYQDTSVAQTRLLSGLFAGTTVMAVGDPHQAIYGWRGASAGNLGDFATAFARETDCGRYSLMTSWRNSSDVLTAASAVLAPLATSSPVEVGALRPRPGASSGRVEIAVAADVDAEAARVAEWFESVRDERARAGQGTTGAVLLRSKKHMERFADALGARGIPHRILGLGGLLSTPEVVDVVSALRVISDPRAGSALIRLLAGPRWALGLADLRALAQLARRITEHDAALQRLTPDVAQRVRSSSGDDQGSLIDALDFVLRVKDDHGWLSGFTPAARERLRDAAAVFAGLRRAAGAPIGELVRLIELELRLDIELAANETRGPARIASAQLRAFVDEVQAFLSADDSGSLPSLLAWLDHAEELDEFAPRTEPPEDDVVQLLTIHGSKGLEWDAVAVVRMVEDELPTASRDSGGWLGFGVLPYDFRGDAAWLPTLAWRGAQTQQEMVKAIKEFRQANVSRQVDEDRRLAYVAVTRARDHLLLSGSPWGGQTMPRGHSPFLIEIAKALDVALPGGEAGENPFEGRRRLLQWPMDALGERRERVEEAAAAVRVAQRSAPAVADDDLSLLLAERAARARPAGGSAPVRIPASRYKDFVADYAGTVAAISRPMPERPYRQTRLGTLFHAWVERRSGLVGVSGSLDDALWETDAAADADTAALRSLQGAFDRSEWAQLAPIEVETEIDFPFDDLDGTPHLAICKLDAVYRRGDRYEIVDWKTGAPPRNDTERQARLLQLELYRRAYHAKHGIPLDQIDVTLFYVAHDLIVRG
ncbi:ATP-dependent DNA helicase [Microbacterium horticulturae]|uniref:DNA 3'-5' helicase n=1 Tax=Microbacterium horticulturae TaxID=3028316 RepID=A0ABY8BTK0_9MICO|nr:ATP-dependent DNA helicase [Microbacterium sp. KACC 23027]WEG07499.1 ATP-dependent DNA helicase [Microbacterium sp. KACC 23027]